jgi:hypothetical protein
MISFKVKVFVDKNENDGDDETPDLRVEKDETPVRLKVRLRVRGNIVIGGEWGFKREGRRKTAVDRKQKESNPYPRYDDSPVYTFRLSLKVFHEAK